MPLKGSKVQANDSDEANTHGNMLEDISKVVKGVIQPEVSSLKTEIQQAIAPVKAEIDACKAQLADHKEDLNTLVAWIDSLEASLW